jgi:cell shape-determining protein MreD
LKRALALIALALFAPIVQGAIVPYLPRGACPDAGLLLVVALGLSLRATGLGLALTACVGFVADLLSGALLGSHAFLWVLAFGVARFTSLHVNLKGPFMQLALAASLTVAVALGLAGLTAFFGSAQVRSLVAPVELLRQVIANGLVAPVAIALVAWLVTRLSDDGGPRMLRLDPRGYTP